MEDDVKFKTEEDVENSFGDELFNEWKLLEKGKVSYPREIVSKMAFELTLRGF